MSRRKSKLQILQSGIFFFMGFIIGIGSIWPGLVSDGFNGPELVSSGFGRPGVV